jgi:iron complex outermembrane receptor protein
MRDGERARGLNNRISEQIVPHPLNRIAVAVGLALSGAAANAQTATSEPKTLAKVSVAAPEPEATPKVDRVSSPKFTQDLIDTPQCKADGGTGIGDHSVASCITPARDVTTVTRANIALKEERGKNFSVGFFWKPSTAFSASIDLFSVKLEDLVTTPDLQNILNQNAIDGSNADAIVRDCGQVDNPGCLYVIDVQAQNVAYKKTKGLDASLDYALDVSGAGRFNVGLNATYLLDVEMRESIYSEPVDVLREGQLGESVRLKGGAQFGWQREAWSTNVFVNYIGSFTPLNTAYVHEIGSFTTVNVSVNYHLPWQGDVTLGVDNILDRQPPLDLQNGDTSLTFYHQQFHDVDGAKWFVGYRQKFGGG